MSGKTKQSVYDDADLQRRIPESDKMSQLEGVDPSQRSEFARDRARILHSSALRRLAGKTQVVVPGEDDFPRTRLTHSLEVAQIAREVGLALGLDPDITDAAGLAHDLGHPPFGHNGEQALNTLMDPYGGFEGNAQTLRVLTRLESKVVVGDTDGGLNLTRAVLDATSKYPWPRRAQTSKFGVYDDDLPAFWWMRDGRDDDAVCMEAQVMDWADDVAYSVHDVEDGVVTGLIDLRVLADPAEADELARLAAGEYSEADPGELRDAVARLAALPIVRDVTAYGADVGQSRHGRAALKRMTSEILGRFSSAAVHHTLAAYGANPLNRYHAMLLVPDQVRAECAVLKATALRYVMQREGAAQLQASQRELLAELVTALTEQPGQLAGLHAAAFALASTDEQRARVIIDQVAELTDRSAIGWHRRLCRHED